MAHVRKKNNTFFQGKIRGLKKTRMTMQQQQRRQKKENYFSGACLQRKEEKREIRKTNKSFF